MHYHADHRYWILYRRHRLSSVDFDHGQLDGCDAKAEAEAEAEVEAKAGAQAEADAGSGSSSGANSAPASGIQSVGQFCYSTTDHEAVQNSGLLVEASQCHRALSSSYLATWACVKKRMMLLLLLP